jgi:hypothetical protein
MMVILIGLASKDWGKRKMSEELPKDWTPMPVEFECKATITINKYNEWIIRLTEVPEAIYDSIKEPEVEGQKHGSLIVNLVIKKQKANK